MKKSLHRRNKALVKELSVPPPGAKDLYFPTQYSQNTWGQFKSCIWKQWMTYWRSPDYNLVRYFFSLAAALMVGTIFWNVGSKRYIYIYTPKKHFHVLQYYKRIKLFTNIWLSQSKTNRNNVLILSISHDSEQAMVILWPSLGLCMVLYYLWGSTIVQLYNQLWLSKELCSIENALLECTQHYPMPWHRWGRLMFSDLN